MTRHGIVDTTLPATTMTGSMLQKTRPYRKPFRSLVRLPWQWHDANTTVTTGPDMQPLLRKPLHMRICALLLALLSLVAVRMAVAAPASHPTRLIDSFVITDVEGLAKTFSGRVSKTFIATPDGGPVWVMTNYLAEEGTSGDLPVTSFDIMPRNVTVPAGDNIVRFPGREMARFKPEEGLRITIGGKTHTLSDAVLKELMTPEQFAEYQKAKESTQGILQLVNLQRFNIPPDTDTEIAVELIRLENMKPHSLEVVIGQGDIPPELLQFMEKQNGSWLYRNRHLLAMLASVVLFGGWLWRRALGTS